VTLLRLASRRTFASLRRHRNYRLFFYGQLTSVAGTWMQNIAMAWLVVGLAPHSRGLAVGLLAACRFGPFTVLGLFSGVVTDRFDNRRVVIATQSVQMVFSAVLAAVTLLGHVQLWEVYAIAVLTGSALVFDAPSRQNLTFQMVGRDELPNAIALNSSLFNASRIFGPAAAGMIYGFTGAGVCFLVNAISFFAVLVGLLAMRTRDFFPLEKFERPTILSGTREGLAYVRRQPRMMVVILLTLIVSTFSFNFNVTLPVLAYSTLHTQAQVYGILSALFGAGALVGALTAASLGRASAKVMLVGSLVFTGSELALAPVHTPILAGVLLFLTGAGFTAWSANSNAMMQLAAPDRLRGRVIGIYFYAFNGTGPAAGLLAGWLCARGGTQLAFIVAGCAGLAGTAVAAVRMQRVRRLRLPGIPAVPQRRAA